MPNEIEPILVDLEFVNFYVLLSPEPSEVFGAFDRVVIAQPLEVPLVPCLVPGKQRSNELFCIAYPRSSDEA